MECVEVTKFDSDSQNKEQTELLDVMVLKTCGQLVFDLLRRCRDNDEPSTDCDSCDTVSSIGTADNNCTSSNNSIKSIGETYLDVMMDRAFNIIYDAMSHDLEKAERRYQAPPKLQLYNELRSFVHYYKLHQINRYY